MLLGLSLGPCFPEQDSPPPVVVCSLGYCSARIVTVRLVDGAEPSTGGMGHWRLCIEVARNRLTTARHILGGFEGVFTHLYHGRVDDFGLQLLPKAEFKERTVPRTSFVRAAKAKASKNQDFLLERTIESQIRSFLVVPDVLIGFLLFQLPTVMQYQWLYSACGFFQAACREYSFAGGSVRNVLRRRNTTPDFERERQELEHVVLSSFRVIEAIVGEPGSEARFRKLLTQRGLSFDETVGFPGTRRRSLGNAIRNLQKLRDSTSAHGVRRRHDPVTWYEATEAQHLAENVLHQVLWQACCERGRPEGTIEETQYLLDQMYPFCRTTGWLSRPFAELDGMTPVEASRQPNGLAKVHRLSQTILKLK
jgi:hypothetical protein